jgi:hypothetical protein
MAVNTLVTSLILFKIFKVFVEVKPTSVERTLGSTGGTKLRHIIFVIIESGVMLFAIQLVRVVLSILPVQLTPPNSVDLVIGISQMINVIIRSVHFYFFCLTDSIYDFTWLGYHTNDNFGAGLKEIVLR